MKVDSLRKRVSVILAVVLVVWVHDITHAETPGQVPRGLTPASAPDRLQQALERYRQIAAQGDWPFLDPGPPLRRGDRGTEVIRLRTRLEISGDLRRQEGDQRAHFDATLERAVRVFQQRQGLAADGVVGVATRSALNVPVATRVQQMALNLRRWRALSNNLGERYILVNIPDFTLQVIEHSQPVMTMRVIVGKPTWPTPTLSSSILQVVINPAWEVPPRIARLEILPMIKRDPTYALRNRLKILQGWDSEAREIDPQKLDWSTLSLDNFPYHLRQEPGPTNALGRLKFVFPNPFHVYMHDTPERSLFSRRKRLFSHGCIRLEKAFDLATYLVQNLPAWSRSRLRAAIRQHHEQRIHLPEALPVHLVYFTAWVDERNTVQFRPDVYGYDQTQIPHEKASGSCG
jgi:murein L,D-transpeptidase YcbB/YkuD